MDVDDDCIVEKGYHHELLSRFALFYLLGFWGVRMLSLGTLDHSSRSSFHHRSPETQASILGLAVMSSFISLLSPMYFSLFLLLSTLGTNFAQHVQIFMNNSIYSCYTNCIPIVFIHMDFI